MRTPEEIKIGLKCLATMRTGSCDKAPCKTCDFYAPCYYSVELCADALAYIQRLEASEAGSKERFERTYDKLQDAYKTIDGAENCMNCLYGDGSHEYCYDCRWFDGGSNRLKWVDKSEEP